MAIPSLTDDVGSVVEHAVERDGEVWTVRLECSARATWQVQALRRDGALAVMHYRGELRRSVLVYRFVGANGVESRGSDWVDVLGQALESGA